MTGKSITPRDYVFGQAHHVAIGAFSGVNKGFLATAGSLLGIEFAKMSGMVANTGLGSTFTALSGVVVIIAAPWIAQKTKSYASNIPTDSAQNLNRIGRYVDVVVPASAALTSIVRHLQ